MKEDQFLHHRNGRLNLNSAKRKEPTLGSALPTSMVAGTGFEPVTFGL